MVGSRGNGRCYVISPIGDEGSEERLHADEVLTRIITPAMNACELEAQRSDQITMPG
jgi:hypothetical protein